MSGQIKIGVTVETPHGKGIVVKVERYKCFRRWAVILYDKSPFSFNPVWYNHGELKLVNEKETQKNVNSKRTKSDTHHNHSSKACILQTGGTGCN